MSVTHGNSFYQYNKLIYFDCITSVNLFHMMTLLYLTCLLNADSPISRFFFYRWTKMCY